MRYKNKISWFLKQAGKTQCALARYVGVTTLTANKWCVNRCNPRYEEDGKKVVEFLNQFLKNKIQIEDLFFFEKR